MTMQMRTGPLGPAPLLLMMLTAVSSSSLELVLVLVLVLVLGPAVARRRAAMTTRDPALSIVSVASHAAYELRSDQPCPPISSPPWLPRCSFRWCGASRRRSLASTCWARWEAQVAMC